MMIKLLDDFSLMSFTSQGIMNSFFDKYNDYENKINKSFLHSNLVLELINIDFKKRLYGFY